MKRAIYPLYAAADEARVKPILDALAAKGVSVQKTSPGKEDALVLFLSKNFDGEGPLADTFIRLNAGRELVIPVNLDGSTPPEELESALMARHALDGQKYSAAELANLIERAVRGKSRLPLVLAVLAAVAVLVVGGLILWKQMGEPDLKIALGLASPTPTVTPIPTATPTPTAAPTPTPTAVPTPTPPLPDNADITLEQLESVHELIIVGDAFTFFTGEEAWIRDAGWARVGAEYVANRSFEEGAAHWYSATDGHEFALYDWGDLAFLPYMKNLKLLSLVQVEGTLPDLSELKNLDCVELFDCRLQDLSGLRGTALHFFGYKGGAADFSPLNDSSRMDQVDMELYGWADVDLSGFGPARLHGLTLSGQGNERSADLSGLKNATTLNNASIRFLPLADLMCLSEAKELQNLELFGMDGLQSLRGLEDHSRLYQLRIDNCPGLRDCRALNGCAYLKSLYIQDCPLEDLSFLSEAVYLYELEVENMSTLRSLRGLEDHGNLERANFNNLEGLTDISALSSCRKLRDLLFGGCFSLEDISPVVKLPNLRSLHLYGAGPDNVDYLWDIANKNYFSFGVSEVRDWSGLEAIKTYDFLNITDRNGSALPHIQNATVTAFELWNRGGAGNQGEGIDLSMLPNVTTRMRLHCVPTLEGMPRLGIDQLELLECPRLSSLAGLENLYALKHLNISDCPRLTDWSALEGRKLDELNLEALFALPDFGKMDVRQIGLTTIYDLKDLSCFDAYRPSDPYRIGLMDVDDVTDLSPLYHLHGSYLWVPAHLREQAQTLQDSGLLDGFEVTYPEGGWEPIVPHIELFSLEEIDTLPSALLSRVTELVLAGDAIMPREGGWVEEDWSDSPPTLYMRDDWTEARTPVEPGTLTDFDRLSKLTGLVDLEIWNQPELASLEGIEALGDLRYLKINQCPALADASPAFTVQSLEELMLRFTGVTSLQGIQNLYALKQLDVNDSPVADLSLLGELSALERVTFRLPMMTFEELVALPEGLRQYIQNVTIAGDYVYDGGPWWFEDDWIADSHQLYLHNNETDERLPLPEGTVTDMGALAALMPNLETLDLFAQPLTTLEGIEAFGQLRRISIEECRRIEAFDPLWRVPTLEEVSLRNEPMESLEGIENLPHLVSLSLSGASVKDFSPLTRVDYSYCTSEDYFGYGFMLALDVRDAQSLTFEDYAPLEAVPVYWNLNMNNVPVALWFDHILGKELHEFSCHRSGMSNEQLRAFAEAHPMLERLTLSWNPQLTDISCLLTLPELREVWLSEDMERAIASLGEEFGFDLQID